MYSNTRWSQRHCTSSPYCEARWVSCPLAQLQHKCFAGKEKFQSNHRKCSNHWPVHQQTGNSCGWFFFFRDTYVVCCHENYFTWNQNFVFREEIFHLILPNLQENLSFFFQNEEQVKWRRVSEQTKQTFAVTCFSGQTNKILYSPHLESKDKCFLTWKPECKSASIQVNRLEV